MAEELPPGTIQITHRFGWVSIDPELVPPVSDAVHYFRVDDVFVYEPFLLDFGPLNLSMTCRFVRHLDEKLRDPELKGKFIVHYCAEDAGVRANNALLACAHALLSGGKTPEQAWEPFEPIEDTFPPFRDATNHPSHWDLWIIDCLRGLQKAVELGWLDYKRFDVELYEHFEAVEYGDMHWQVPGKFLAFSGPHAKGVDEDGYPAFTPEDYVPIFKNGGVNLVVRLTRKRYDRKRFIENGVRHIDLYFPDGSCPPQEIVDRFLYVCEHEVEGVAVHCKAGLGRTGTLIGLYAMKHYQFPARALIGWMRICRPGSILGPQQQYLCDMEQDMFEDGRNDSQWDDMIDRNGSADPSRASKEVCAKTAAARSKEDVGQGSRLTRAKKKAGLFSSTLGTLPIGDGDDAESPRPDGSNGTGSPKSPLSASNFQSEEGAQPTSIGKSATAPGAPMERPQLSSRHNSKELDPSSPHSSVSLKNVFGVSPKT